MVIVRVVVVGERLSCVWLEFSWRTHCSCDCGICKREERHTASHRHHRTSNTQRKSPQHALTENLRQSLYNNPNRRHDHRRRRTRAPPQPRRPRERPPQHKGTHPSSPLAAPINPPTNIPADSNRHPLAHRLALWRRRRHPRARVLLGLHLLPCRLVRGQCVHGRAEHRRQAREVL